MGKFTMVKLLAFMVPIALSSCLDTLAAEARAPVTYALRGTLVTPNGLVENGTVLIREHTIIAVGAHIDLPANATVIDTHAEIAPGLIDLHNHLTFNVFPRWHPIQEFNNRYDWQQKQIYQTLIESPHEALVSDGVACAMERYAEVKALSEGETSVTGSLKSNCSAGLARNLDNEAAWHVAYDVFPLQTSEADIALIRDQLSNHTLHAFLIHLNEGGHEDASAMREFAMLQGRGLLLPGVSLIHGVGLQPANFTLMAAHGVNLIWSPRSNLELYGNTADVAAAKAAHVVIALAPDWSLTGSDGLLAELNYAAAWNDTQLPPPFTDRELVAMTTTNAAELAGASDRLGALLPGHEADLLVVRPESDGGNHDAWWTLTHATAAQVMLVTVSGAALYGDPDVMAKLAPGASEALQVCGQTKILSLTGAQGRVDAADETWAHTTATLETALHHHGRNLAVLAECGQ